MNLLWVFLGGGLGSVIRYALSLIFLPLKDSSLFPWATFLSNLISTAILGLLAFFWLQKLNETQRLFWMVGFCGGFSTFSTFSLENWQLIEQKAWWALGLNIGLSLSLALLVLALIARQQA